MLSDNRMCKNLEGGSSSEELGLKTIKKVKVLDHILAENNPTVDI